MSDNIKFALGLIGVALVAVWCVDRLLCRFYDWQDRKRATRTLRECERVAAAAWRKWDEQEVRL